MIELNKISCDYFENEYFLESDIVRLIYDRRLKQIDFVVNYIAESASAYLEHLDSGKSAQSFRMSQFDFRLLRFYNVSDISCPPVFSKEMDNSLETGDSNSWRHIEKKLLTPRPRSVTGLECKPIKAGAVFSVWFDSTGKFSWHSSSIALSRKIVKIRRENDEVIEYLDSLTSEKVDPANPFGNP